MGGRCRSSSSIFYSSVGSGISKEGLKMLMLSMEVLTSI
jgi:hypothetical protein